MTPSVTTVRKPGGQRERVSGTRLAAAQAQEGPCGAAFGCGGDSGSGRCPRRRPGRLCFSFLSLCLCFFNLVHVLLTPLKRGAGEWSWNHRALILWWKPLAVALGRPVRISPTPWGGGAHAGPRDFRRGVFQASGRPAAGSHAADSASGERSGADGPLGVGRGPALAFPGCGCNRRSWDTLGKQCPPQGRPPSNRLRAPCRTLPWSSRSLWDPDQKVRTTRRSVR